jgi:cell division septal protein FtsQ
MKAAPPKYRNQRLFRPSRQRKQQHLLEVSIRRDRERAIRLKAVSLFIFKATLLLSVLAGLWFGGKEAFRRYVWENEYFYLTEVKPHTDGTLTREQIITASGIKEGMNFFQLNLTKVREGLEHLPQVERVELDRSWPNKLSIEIFERQPIAWLTDRVEVDPTANERALLVDARGYVMTSKKRRQDFIHLPTISGVVLEDFAPGQKASNMEIQAALELIRLNADSTRWQIRNVDVSKLYCLVVTDRKHARVTFGLEDIDRHLTQFYRLLDYLEPTHREIQTVNLLVERNTPVTFMDEVEAEPATSPPTAEAVGAKPDKTGADKSAKAKPSEPAPASHGGFVKPAETPAKPASSGKEKGNSPSRKSTDSVRKPFRSNG